MSKETYYSVKRDLLQGTGHCWCERLLGILSKVSLHANKRVCVRINEFLYEKSSSCLPFLPPQHLLPPPLLYRRTLC